MNPADLIHLLVAALGGTAVGLERQWSGHTEGPAARFAGIRTFTMLGAVAGLSGWMWTQGMAVPAGILLSGAVVIIAAAYVAGSRHDIDGTTEVAALIVIGAGVLAGLGAVRVASGIIAVTSLLLVEKSRLHALVRRIDSVELRDGVHFGVMALVVLPLLPEGPYGPLGGVRPRELWALVLFFSGLSFVGHVMRRLLGPGYGYLSSGVVGGLVSSTNVTLTFARLSRGDPSIERALAFGAIGANAVLFPRVLAATAVLNPALALPLAPYLVAPALIATGVAALGVIKSNLTVGTGASVPTRNPLQLSSALQMAALFQFVILIVSLMRRTWGEAGVLTTAAVLGLTDVDALTVSMAREIAATTTLEMAALAITVGVLANTALKAGVALAFGSSRFRFIVGGTLLLMIAAIAGGIWWI